MMGEFETTNDKNGKLPAEEKDAIASLILAELADEQEWTTCFNATTDQQWDRLSELARQEISAGDQGSAEAEG